ncbi:hypothetical protein [Enterobacter roggenkampii]|uniref:hypothetical protein n=1 Tax=Enterobacter roggenkampii TaxID=1812935 RepID=UPI001330B161|nr:hypothetical protein [Enterobacter roggenkampii]
MSNIDKRAQKELYAKVEQQAHKLRGNPIAYQVVTGMCPVNVIEMHAQKVQALLDELEAKETENERMAREMLNRSGEIEGLRQRIAELESREINMPPYSFFDFKQGSPFKCGAYCHIDSLNTELSKHGIKITAAACKGGAS